MVYMVRFETFVYKVEKLQKMEASQLSDYDYLWLMFVLSVPAARGGRAAGGAGRRRRRAVPAAARARPAPRAAAARH